MTARTRLHHCKAECRRRRNPNFDGWPLHKALGGVVDTKVNRGGAVRGSDALHCAACDRLPSNSMSRAESLLAELQGAKRPKGSVMSKETIASLRASKNRMRAALDKVAVHADSFATEAEVMAEVSGNTFSGAGEAMKSIVAEVMEVRDIFDLDASSNGGPPLKGPTTALGQGSGAPAGSSVKTEITALGPVQRVV